VIFAGFGRLGRYWGNMFMWNHSVMVYHGSFKSSQIRDKYMGTCGRSELLGFLDGTNRSLSI